MRWFILLVLYVVAVGPGHAQRLQDRPVQPAAAPGQDRAARNAQLDQYAQRVPATYTGSVAVLAGYLSKAARSDYDKARLIYAWLGQHIGYDVRWLQLKNAGQPVDNDDLLPDAVLRRRVAICAGYADLFQALADTMHLRAEVVSGYAKPGPTPPGGYHFTQTNHAWNAFFADGRWHLTDATWAAGSVDDADQPTTFTAQYTARWFDPVPTTFVFSHLPEEPRWQLLPQPLTLARYESLPYVVEAEEEYQQLPSVMRLVLAAPGLPCLPLLRRCDVAVQFQQIPLTDTLTAGQPYRFALDLPLGYTVVAFNNSHDLDVDGRELALTQRGQHFSAVLTPTAGKLTLILHSVRNDENWTYPLEYEVRPAARLAGQ